MLNYGIELEFFVKNSEDKIIPAIEVTANVDGNPVIGEIRTGIHNNIVDCIFELKKLLFLEQEKLTKKICTLHLYDNIKVDNDFLKNLRKSNVYVENKHVAILEELSIYPKGSTGKVLSKNIIKASLQVNFSNNIELSYTKKKKEHKIYSNEIFDYIYFISKLDVAFKEDIIRTQRVKGVYAIKQGKLGKRIEYRSLPNDINLDKLLNVLNN